MAAAIVQTTCTILPNRFGSLVNRARRPDDRGMTPKREGGFADRIGKLAPTAGIHSYGWNGLRTIRSEETTRRALVVYEPCLCFVAAGAKQAWLNEEVYRYDPEQFLCLSVSLPLECEIVEASPDAPYLAMVLDVDTLVLGELIEQLDRDVESASSDPSEDARRGIFATQIDSGLLDAVLRLTEVVADETELRVLGPGLYREVLFRVLQGPQAGSLRSIGDADGRSARVAKVIRFLHEHFDEPLDVATLAEAGAMSASTLHHAFKSVTSDSPLAYLKKLRLHQARALMLHQGLGAAEAAYQVGYGSASQFSREFKRQFGASPREELSRARSEG